MRYTVEFEKGYVQTDRNAITVEADSFEAAMARVEAWGRGEIELSEAEEESERNIDCIEVQACEFEAVRPLDMQPVTEPLP